MRWEKVQAQVGHGRAKDEGGLAVNEISGPGKRWGHTCNAIKAGRLLYVFGGYGKDNCLTNQVHVFDTVKLAWCQPLIKGTPPVPRDSHSCTTIGDSLFVFGGTDGMNPLNDLHILDTSSHTWISPFLRGEGPKAREGHGAALVGKRLFIFGGGGKPSENNDEIYYNDLYTLDTETFVWISAATSGTPPSPRDSHSCSSWKNKFIVVGGEDRHDYYLSDVHILDTDTLIWTEVKTSGQILSPRAGHSTVAFGRNLFVFGGFSDAQILHSDLYVLDVDSGLWTKVATKGDGPSARFSLDGDCLDPSRSGVLVFFGGCNKNLEALADMYYLHTGLVREGQQRLEKLSLRKQLKKKCQEQNLNPLVVNVGTDISQPLSLTRYRQASMQIPPLNQHLPPPGKKTFQAIITESTSAGITIETVIDGKPLRGILFRNSPTSCIPTPPSSSRKRALEETGGATTSDGVDRRELRASKVAGQNVEDSQVDAVRGNELTTPELQAKAITYPVSTELAIRKRALEETGGATSYGVDRSELRASKVAEQSEVEDSPVDVIPGSELTSSELQKKAVNNPSSTDLAMPAATTPLKPQASSNEEHDQRNDASVSLTDNVQRDCQSSDTPKCSMEAPNPILLKDPGHSSPKQGGNSSS